MTHSLTNLLTLLQLESKRWLAHLKTVTLACFAGTVVVPGQDHLGQDICHDPLCLGRGRTNIIRSSLNISNHCHYRVL